MEILETCAAGLGMRLDEEQLKQFFTLYTELIDWNSRFNLTGITGYDDVLLKHFCDSLTVVLAFRPADKEKTWRVIDIGAGAGFPGIPLKIAFPEIRLTLLESTRKKAVFLEHVTEKLGLSGVEIVTGRAEEAAHDKQYRERFDVVLSRAVAPLPALVELCLPFCKTGGRFIAQKKGDIVEENRQAAKAIKVMGGFLRDIMHVNLDELADGRRLVVIDKISPTPREYPRRPGIPAKKPIL